MYGINHLKKNKMKELNYKNQIIKAIKVRMEWQNKSYWTFLINGQGGDDLYKTQKDCIDTAKYVIDNDL